MVTMNSYRMHMQFSDVVIGGPELLRCIYKGLQNIHPRRTFSKNPLAYIQYLTSN